MCTPNMALYPILNQLLLSLYGSLHLASLQSVTDLVWSLLLCQSLHPSDLARSLPDLQAGGARQALRRVRRIVNRAHLSSECLTPFLIRVVLCLVPDKEVKLILDTTRCRRWEIFTLGVMFHGRVLPVAWGILPYPWPRGRFTPTVLALVNRALAAWPEDRPLHLLADRGFPSLKLFRLLDSWRKALPLGYTIRLRAGDWVQVAEGPVTKMADLMTKGLLGGWTTYQASYQHRGKFSEASLLVVGRGLPSYPAHQRGPADQARRVARERRRIAHVLSKKQAKAPDTDTVWALLSTSADSAQAICNYSLRFSTEGTYRDLKSWDLEAVAGHEIDAGHLDGLMGLATLGYITQAVIGMEAGRATQVQARARQQQWTTTDRISVFWRGRQVLHDHAHDWRCWLKRALPKLVHQLSPQTYAQYQEAA